MATIVKVNMSEQIGAFSPTASVMTANDVVPYDETQRQILSLQNVGGSAITATLKGNAASSVNISGVGSVSVSGGFSVLVPAGKMQLVQLNSVRHYLIGDTVNITGGAGLLAFVLEV